MIRARNPQSIKNKISIIIANYNTKSILRDCLNNLEGKYPNLEVIVVDNGSVDGSYEMVKKQFPWVKSIKEENKGISHAYNIGIEESTGDYYLFLGSDAFPKKETLSGLLNYMENNLRVGICTPKLLLRDGTLDMDAHRGLPTPWAAFTHFSKLGRLFPNTKIFGQYFLSYEDMSKPHEIGLCISHFMFVRKEVFDSVIGWDEDFFVFGEDVDFCYRVKEAGWKIMYLPQFEVLHLKGVSVGIRRSSKDISKASMDTKSKMRGHTVKAMKLFYEKHYMHKYPWVMTKIIYAGIRAMRFLRGF